MSPEKPRQTRLFQGFRPDMEKLVKAGHHLVEELHELDPEKLLAIIKSNEKSGVEGLEHIAKAIREELKRRGLDIGQ